MRIRQPSVTVTNASPATASTTVGANQFNMAWARSADSLVVDAILQAGAGGTLDVYLQRRLSPNPNVWMDWIHFPQIAAGQSRSYSLAIIGDTATITQVGVGTDASPNVTLAANAAVNVTPGDLVRVVFVAGAGTSGSASNSITITPYTFRM